MPKTHLPTRPLGKTGLEITPVGFGAWAIGGDSWGPQDDNDSVAAIRHAVASGVNWIDTAAIYGRGHSEEIVAEALKGIGKDERPYVFTKCGLVWDPNNKNDVRRSGDPASIRREVEASLKRLDVEVIDLYQMHWPASDFPLETYWQALLDLKKEGKVLHVGLSNHDAGALATCEKLGHVETLQPPFSMIRRDVAAEILPWCNAHETGTIVYSPMQAGLLTGTFSAERAARLPDSDWRKKDSQFTGETLEKNLALVEALRPIAEKHEANIGEVALAWALAWPGLTATIVGARSPAQIDGWIGAATLALDADDFATIEKAITATGAGSGPLQA
ncbi:aldo/keto reductase [Kaistia dalseonensis]|uniref:Aryl-alcohol dehydrogenase-like predicted oxidoreductase n=1 Tax=Kaistia dalseonensis TaxID=410840 RepID=A0ABU0HC94_9HYPH|nr:aldo/keto reductase [Kaistia dalseonensis]MCX5496857.1 aldo/keto reductase [Kaistia dalseonensis]MDQ0439483.1 aryl-alcohol dehydrogenase-like predicted oxidoreductase [Kaistia dalseonensis]